MIPGFATPDGTEAFQARFDGKAHPDHFGRHQGLRLSSLGIGTYLGEADDATDAGYRAAVAAAAQGGINVIDTAIHYRHQRSERAVGQALRELLDAGFRREELLVCSKGGFLAYDGAPPENPGRWFVEQLAQRGIAKAEDLVAGGHCMTPRFLAHQLDRSRQNLGVACIDVYYLHNPETQLEEVSEQDFVRRLGEAFLFLEEAAKAGAIRYYGTATWDGFRASPQSASYLPLSAMVEIARALAGDGHHYRFLQLPFSLAAAEAHGYTNQLVGEGTRSLLGAAAHFGMTVVGSAPLLQGRVPQSLPPDLEPFFPGCVTNAQRAIQFARSAPGLATALVGMSRTAHVAEALAVAALPKMEREAFEGLFRK
jgi:aryl-alcohol dehydrogenase-like predicted oxidoreductase